MKFRDFTLEVIPGRTTPALALGALTGGGLTVLAPTVLTLISNSGQGVSGWQAVSWIPAATIFAALLWSVGHVCVGIPAWWAFDKLGLRSPFAAAGLGALLPSLAFGLVSGGVWSAAFLTAPIGMTVALVIWRVAYRPRSAVKLPEHGS